MALYEVTLFQTYMQQEIINRWNYISTGTPAAVTGSYALANALGAIFESAGIGTAYDNNKMMCKIAALQGTAVAFDGLAVRNIYEPNDFYETPFIQPLNGAQTLDANTPFVSVGFRTSRVNGEIRRGQKRFTGVPESQVGPGGTLIAAYVTTANALAVEMADVQPYTDEGNTLSFAPAIVSKECYDPSGGNGCNVKKGHKAYRYYEDLAEQLEHVAQGFSWELYPQVRSQTSRQIGRGR